MAHAGIDWWLYCFTYYTLFLHTSRSKLKLINSSITIVVSKSMEWSNYPRNPLVQIQSSIFNHSDPILVLLNKLSKDSRRKSFDVYLTQRIDATSAYYYDNKWKLRIVTANGSQDAAATCHFVKEIKVLFSAEKNKIKLL